MSVEIYKSGENIYIPAATVGVWPVGALQAVGNGDGTVSVANRGKVDPDGNNFLEIASVAYAQIVDDTGATYGASEVAVVNALNSLFSDSALVPPTITSATSVSVGVGVAVNYELTGAGIVGVEWSGLPAGVAPAANNRRFLTGSISSPGTTVATVTATNALGSTQQTVTFVATSTFSDTKSVRFNTNDYMQMSPSVSTTDRAGNGSGAADAWSIACWLKPSTSSNASQTIWCFGSTPLNSAGNAWLFYRGRNNENIELRYGTNFNRLRLQTASGTTLQGQWHHVMVTYDGGTTGASSGSIADYYSRFSIFIDGAVVTTTNLNDNFGYTGAISSVLSRVGRSPSGQYSRGNLVNELAIFDSDQTSNVSAIYNAGVPHDLSLLTVPPVHWWRMGDGDTFPTISDNVGSSDGTLFNMTSADIVSDVP